MSITELIEELRDLQDEFGDVEVKLLQIFEDDTGEEFYNARIECVEIADDEGERIVTIY